MSQKENRRACDAADQQDLLAHAPANSQNSTITQAFLTERAERIRVLGKRVTGDVIEIGRLLIECRERCGHGNWLPWLDREFGWSADTAERFIRLNKLADQIPQIAEYDIPVSGLYQLAAPSTPESARTEVITRAEAGERMGRAEVQAIVATHSTPAVQAVAPAWTQDQLDRKAKAEQGICVVANMHKNTDDALVAWAEANDRLIKIDRQTDWGNPYEMPADGDRAEVVGKHANIYWPHKTSLFDQVPKLAGKGKVLGCWCYPDQCHGDVIAETINRAATMPANGAGEKIRRGTGVAMHPHAERGLDLYETPESAVRALLEVERFNGPIWEPACGPGAIVRVLRNSGHTVVATDIKDDAYGCPDSTGGVDFLKQTAAPTGVTAILTNPPFMHANEFVRHALTLVPRVVMLLRLAFLESQGRSDILDGGQLARVHVFRNRLPMMHRSTWEGAEASSAMAFAWFSWDREHHGPTELHRISWESAADNGIGIPSPITPIDGIEIPPPVVAPNDGLDIPGFLRRAR
jgi:hypothetical protein